MKPNLSQLILNYTNYDLITYLILHITMPYHKKQLFITWSKNKRVLPWENNYIKLKSKFTNIGKITLYDKCSMFKCYMQLYFNKMANIKKKLQHMNLITSFNLIVKKTHNIMLTISISHINNMTYISHISSSHQNKNHSLFKPIFRGQYKFKKK